MNSQLLHDVPAVKVKGPANRRQRFKLKARELPKRVQSWVEPEAARALRSRLSASFYFPTQGQAHLEPLNQRRPEAHRRRNTASTGYPTSLPAKIPAQRGLLHHPFLRQGLGLTLRQDLIQHLLIEAREQLGELS